MRASVAVIFTLARSKYTFCRVQQSSGRRRIALSAAIVLGLVFLAAGLNSFELASGLRIQSTEQADRIQEAIETSRSTDRVWLSGEVLGRFVSLAVTLSIVLFFVSQTRKENRIVTALLILILGLIVVLFSRLPPAGDQPPPELVEGDPTLIGQGALGTTEELPEEFVEDVSVPRQSASDPVAWIVSIVGGLGLLIILRPNLRLGRRRTQQMDDPSAAVADQAAQGAADAGSSGEVLSVVLSCYREMLEVYQETRFSGRPQSVTPREFAAKLIAAGVSRTHADDLTALFERARYGEITLSREDEAHAVACLTGISEALRH